MSAVQLPESVWRTVISFLGSPEPARDARGRADWHQPHLTVAMRVNSDWNDWAGRLLYHTCYVDDPYLFLFGLDRAPGEDSEKRCMSKRYQLSRMRRLELVNTTPVLKEAYAGYIKIIDEDAWYGGNCDRIMQWWDMICRAQIRLDSYFSSLSGPRARDTLMPHLDTIGIGAYEPVGWRATIAATETNPSGMSEGRGGYGLLLKRIHTNTWKFLWRLFRLLRPRVVCRPRTGGPAWSAIDRALFPGVEAEDIDNKEGQPFHSDIHAEEMTNYHLHIDLYAIPLIVPLHSAIIPGARNTWFLGRIG
ncbi:hypothetical protein IAU60_002035 [Kwoniella sp. DSM 27419]